MKSDPNNKNSAYNSSSKTESNSSSKTESPRQDRSQEMSGAKDNAKPSGDSPKPHGDPLLDRLMGRKH